MSVHPSQLPLAEYRPRPALTVASHRVERARHAAVDAHNHLGRWLSEDGGWIIPDVGELLALMDRCNVRSLVNLDGRWGDELEANLDRFDRRHPGRFATFCHPDWSLLPAPNGPASIPPPVIAWPSAVVAHRHAPTLTFVPRSGCYLLQARWPGGGWSISFTA